MTNVVVCPSCKGERWEGTGPCGNCGAAVVSSSPDIPDEAVEAAFHVLYPKVPFDPQERDYLEAVAVARAALTAAYPALTRQAVATEREFGTKMIRHAEKLQDERDDLTRRLNDALAIRVRVEVERDELSATVERIRALADEWDAEDDRDPYNELSAEHVVARLRAALAPPPDEPRRITYEQAKRLAEPGYTPPPDHALVKEPTRPADYTTHDDEDDEP